jgi:hypothetical protein
MLRTPRHRDMLYESPFVRGSLKKDDLYSKNRLLQTEQLSKRRSSQTDINRKDDRQMKDGKADT